MNKKQKRNMGLIILITFLAFALFFIPQREKKEISTGVDDKGVNLVVYGWRDGVKVGPLSLVSRGRLFSVVEFAPPGIPLGEIDAISIEHTINSPIADSDADIDVSDIIGTFTTDGIGGNLPVFGDSRYEDEIASLTQSFTLIPGGFIAEESTPFGITDLEDDCNDLPYCEFKLQAVASFEDVDLDTGQMIITDIILSESFGTIVIKVSGEVCSDGTPFGQCSLSAPGGQFCDGLANLINCASPTGCTPTNYAPTSCPCDSGFYETNGDAICSAPMCDGGIAAGLCIGTNALICDPLCTQESCGATIQDCYECGQSGQEQGIPLGWLDSISNAVECPLAYNGDPADSCHEIQKKCKYKGRKGELDVSVVGG